MMYKIIDIVFRYTLLITCWNVFTTIFIIRQLIKFNVELRRDQFLFTV